MLNGIMLLWFLLTAMAVVFVAIDIRSTPASPVLKWGFILLVVYTGPIGAFLYVLGCREPLPGLHEQYVATRWRQVLGSTMHCVAGDGVGILVGAALSSYLTLPRPLGIALEYGLGFGFGWTIFQALFMREMAGGSYRKSLANTFLPEFLSMNLVMTGMMPVAALGRFLVGGKLVSSAPPFWFVMSMALLAGFVVAYPMNWWLVAKGLKHGMITVRTPDITHNTDVPEHEPSQAVAALPNKGHADHATASRTEIVWMVLLSILLFALAAGAVGVLHAARNEKTNSISLGAKIRHLSSIASHRKYPVQRQAITEIEPYRIRLSSARQILSCRGACWVTRYPIAKENMLGVSS